MKLYTIFYPSSIENPREKIHEVVKLYPDAVIEFDDVKGRDNFSTGKMMSKKISLFVLRGTIRYQQRVDGLLAQYRVEDRFERITTRITLFMGALVFFATVLANYTLSINYVVFGGSIIILFTIYSIFLVRYTNALAHKKFISSLQPESLDLYYSISRYSIKLLLFFIFTLYSVSIAVMLVATYMMNTYVGF